jgi:hypothetical protein
MARFIYLYRGPGDEAITLPRKKRRAIRTMVGQIYWADAHY